MKVIILVCLAVSCILQVNCDGIKNPKFNGMMRRLMDNMREEFSCIKQSFQENDESDPELATKIYFYKKIQTSTELSALEKCKWTFGDVKGVYVNIFEKCWNNFLPFFNKITTKTENVICSDDFLNEKANQEIFEGCLGEYLEDVSACVETVDPEIIKSGNFCALKYQEIIPCLKSYFEKCPENGKFIKGTDALLKFFNEECAAN